MLNNSRNQILQSLNSSIGKKAPIEEHIDLSNVFVQPKDDLVFEFVNQLKSISGDCFVVDSFDKAVGKLKEIISNKNVRKISTFNDEIKNIFISDTKYEVTDALEFADVSVSSCEYLIARTGSVLISTSIDSQRRIISAPEIHVVFAYENQLVADLPIALRNIKNKYLENLPSQITVITGPSRTADIEKTLILGAHGPKEFIVILIK